jgi:hypothetical protein
LNRVGNLLVAIFHEVLFSEISALRQISRVLTDESIADSQSQFTILIHLVACSCCKAIRIQTYRILLRSEECSAYRDGVKNKHGLLHRVHVVAASVAVVDGELLARHNECILRVTADTREPLAESSAGMLRQCRLEGDLPSGMITMNNR